MGAVNSSVLAQAPRDSGTRSLACVLSGLPAGWLLRVPLSRRAR